MTALSGVFERRRVTFTAPPPRAEAPPRQHAGESFLAHDAEAGLTVIADARLDNRPDLLARLNLPAVHPLSDGSLILCAWRQWGADCPRHLIGDFAFAVWDARQHRLFCARDHVGARPLYYALTPERMVFASDVRSVLAFPGVSDRLDDDYVAATLLDNGFCSNDRTYFQAVRKLRPGYSLSISPEREWLTRYWRPADALDVRFSSDAAYADAARDIYVRAVADRLRTSLPVGVHLSGGLDSSSVAALAARERRRQGLSPPAVFCWQPPPGERTPMSAEHMCIEALCRQERLLAQYCPMTADDTFAVLRLDPAREPVTSTLIVETATQRRAASQGVRLILSGWGGDDGLSIHGTMCGAELLLSGRWATLYRQGQRHSGRPWRFIAREALLLVAPDRVAMRRLLNRAPRASTGAASWLRPDVLRRTTRRPAISRRRTSVRATVDASWENGGLTERIESWYAHGAAHGITYAYPMLDRRLLEFAAGVPPEQFVHGGTRRSLMRRTMAGILPDEICSQQDKSDPVRSAQALSVVRTALGAIGDRLAADPAAPARARYFDMPRLLDRLRPESLRDTSKVGDLLRTVQFLDF